MGKIEEQIIDEIERTHKQLSPAIISNLSSRIGVIMIAPKGIGMSRISFEKVDRGR